MDHRVQLQCKFDEKEGKYTEAKPRCTCPSYESNLHQVGEVQHQLPLDLMLVHFRPHLYYGYTDQYHYLQQVKSSMITEQSGILIHLGTFVLHTIYFACKGNTFLRKICVFNNSTVLEVTKQEQPLKTLCILNVLSNYKGRHSKIN